MFQTVHSLGPTKGNKNASVWQFVPTTTATPVKRENGYGTGACLATCFVIYRRRQLLRLNGVGDQWMHMELWWNDTESRKLNRSENPSVRCERLGTARLRNGPLKYLTVVLVCPYPDQEAKKKSYSDRKFWFSYILLIIIVGGILVLFIYISD
jgi:hypothetical protein